jgi:hypothetical protein
MPSNTVFVEDFDKKKRSSLGKNPENLRVGAFRGILTAIRIGLLFS